MPPIVGTVIDIIWGFAQTLWRLLTLPIMGPCMAAAWALTLVGSCTKAHEIKSLQKELAAEIDVSEGRRRDLQTCHDNQAAADGAVATQNAGLEASAKEAERRAAAAEKGLTEALRGKSQAEAFAKKMMDLQVKGTVCERIAVSDAALMEMLK